MCAIQKCRRKPLEWLSHGKTGLWFGGAEVILPLGHASPLLVHVAGHVGHCVVLLVRPLGDPVDHGPGVVRTDCLCDGHTWWPASTPPS